MKASPRLKVALVGTESLRGREMKNLLELKNWPLKPLELYDPDVEEEYSKLSEFKGEPKVIRNLDALIPDEMDLVLLAADKESNRALGRQSGEASIPTIDLSGTFNEDPEVPLVVAGVNDGGLEAGRTGLVANPHPATVILSHLYHVLNESFGLSRGIGLIFEPASAYETPGIEELAGQSVAMLNSENLPKDVFKDQLAFNLLCRNEGGDLSGLQSIESRLAGEVRRVLGRPDLPLGLSVIQAPVFHTYSVMNFVELQKPAGVPKLREVFESSPYFSLQAPSPDCSTSSVTAAGESTILVGRIRGEAGFTNTFWIWTVADNLTRGAAVNALEIVQRIFALPD